MTEEEFHKENRRIILSRQNVIKKYANEIEQMNQELLELRLNYEKNV